MTRARQMLIAASIFFGVDAGIHFYLYLRMIRDTHLPSPLREIATAVLVLLALSIPMTFFMMRAVRFEVYRRISLVPFAWLGMMMLLVFGFAAVDIVRGVLFIIERIFGAAFLPTLPEARLTFQRWAAASVVLTAFLLTLISIVNAARKPVVRKVELSLPRLPSALSGLKIVQLSDLHIGGGGTGRDLEQLTKQVNALRPDIIAVTGDLVDGEIRFLKKEVESIQSLRAPLGVYFVTGNHEYYSGVGAWIAEIKRLGLRVLRNEAVPIGNGEDTLYLAGVDDYASRGMVPGHGQDIPKALRHVPKRKTVVLLAHQPKAAKEAAALGVDLVLSGHTHGGQIWPFTYLVAWQQTYNKGLYRLGDTTQLYVNQGTLVWGPPMRLFTENEITEIVLRSAS